MGENRADDKPSSACLLQGGQDPPNEADSVEPMDKNRMMKRKIYPSPLHQLDAVRSSFSFGFQSPPRSMADPTPTPRFGPETSGDPQVSTDQSADRESKRRKHCPSYIVPSFSFNLDHNSDGSPESTPKFGSFPFPAAAATEVESQRDGQALSAPSSREDGEGEGEGQGGGGGGEGSVVS